MEAFVAALTFSAGYNAALVVIGATLFGAAAAASGTFLVLRRQALMTDAIAHATLPGLAIGFMVMAAAGFDGRNLLGLLIGSAISALIGVVAVDVIVKRTRLMEDAAIGAVLSVFFGFGVVLLTIVQSMSAGRQAGLEGFLLGSTAGMLRADAMLIAVSAAVVGVLLFVLRRPLTLVAFDPQYAAGQGVKVRLMDLVATAMVLAVTVIGLKLVGLILVVALLIIPPVAARFWTNDISKVLFLSALFGGSSGYVGAALSASAPALPTGSLVVLSAFAIFVVSLVFSTQRGVLAALLRRRALAVRVHRRQGLLALAAGEPIYDAMTIKVLRRDGVIRPDGVMTDNGRAAVAEIRRDELRWSMAPSVLGDDAVPAQRDALTPADEAFTPDQIALIDAEAQRLAVV